MKNVALYPQQEVVIEGDLTTEHMTIIERTPGDGVCGEIVITKPCIRAFIKALTRVADAMGA